jgi:hypothetical protein
MRPMRTPNLSASHVHHSRERAGRLESRSNARLIPPPIYPQPRRLTPFAPPAHPAGARTPSGFTCCRHRRASERSFKKRFTQSLFLFPIFSFFSIPSSSSPPLPLFLRCRDQGLDGTQGRLALPHHLARGEGRGGAAPRPRRPGVRQWKRERGQHGPRPQAGAVGQKVAGRNVVYVPVRRHQD